MLINVPEHKTNKKLFALKKFEVLMQSTGIQTVVKFKKFSVLLKSMTGALG